MAQAILEVVEATGSLLVLAPEDWPRVEDLVTEDDTPVDNLFSEKQQRLLTEVLYTSWEGPGEGRPFLVLANVGLFYTVREPPLVPDVMLSLDVQAPADLEPKRSRSYFLWEYGKPPEVVVEIVSNVKGGEAESKKGAYARLGVAYYVIFDPFDLLREGVLRVYGLQPGQGYRKMAKAWLEGVGLGLTLWRGEYESLEQDWLRWCDREGSVIPTGAERAAQAEEHAAWERRQREQAEVHTERERQQREQAEAHAAWERQQREQAEARAARLAAQLRALGVEPE